jgi:outer membrane protein W
MKSLIATFVLVFVFFTNAFAQVYNPSWGKKRHRFAQLELGINQTITPNAGTTQVINADGTVKPYNFGTTQSTAFYIGGTHFWGHADFAVSIPLYRNGKGMSYGAELMAKYYPLAIESNKLRPYIGVSMAPFGYAQNDGGSISKVYYPILAGLNFSNRQHQFELGLTYNYNKKFDYYISRTTLGKVELPTLMFNATYKYTLETTAGRERNWLNGKTKATTEALAKDHKLNAFSIAVGPSSAFVMSESPYVKDNTPFLGKYSVKGFLDLGLGYYFYKPDIHLNLAYRTNQATIKGYGVTNTTKRQALTLEAYKFLGDYHGFLPFIGPNISYENLSVKEQDGTKAPVLGSFKGVKAGITFGWDIRPDDLQGWILRTNLRWHPNLGVAMPDGKKMKLDQLEFNFIQLVLYPERLWGGKLRDKKEK